MAQTLSQMRCYFDGNVNAAEYFNLGNASDIDAPFNVNVSVLSNGMHRLYLEVMDNNGRWSLYDSDLIQVGGGLQMAQLNSVEYFFDTDPGMGEGIQIAVAGTDLDDDYALSVDGLSNGIHRLYVRVRDGANQWSLYSSALIQVNGSSYEELLAMEYFFDNDPGFGQATVVPISSLNYDDDITLSLAGVPQGHRKLYIRVMDATGQWSLYASHTVQITGGPEFLNLVQGEYFFDTDPGMGEALPILIPSGPSVDAEFDLAVPADLPQTAHVLYVRVKDNAGQWSLYATQNIQVCSIQQPTITQTGGGCVGSIATLSVESGYNSYVWNNDAISQNILVPQPGTYSVTVTDADCSATVSIDVTFDSPPTPEIIQSGIACTGNAVTLDAGSGYASYNWSTSQQSQTIQVSQSGLYSVTVSNGSCTGTDFINVTFGELQSPTIEILGDPCVDDVLTLDAGSGYSLYAWSQGSSSQTIDVSETGSYAVTVADGVCSASNQIFVEFGNIIPPVISQAGGTCEGDNVTLNAGSGYDYYIWSTFEDSQSITVTQSGTYSVEVGFGDCAASDIITIDLIEIAPPIITQSGDACVDAFITLDAGAGYDEYAWSNNTFAQTTQINESGAYEVVVSNGTCSSQGFITVEFGQPAEPQITISGGFCYGEDFTLDAGAGYSSYLWSNGMQSQIIVVSEEGEYSVEVANGSCSSSASISADWAVQFPVPLIVQSVNTLTSDIDPLLYTIQWYFNGNPIPDATSSSYQATESGVYTVSAHDGICTIYSDELDFIYNSVETYAFNKIWIYPNPGSDVIQIKTNLGNSAEWTLINHLGQVVQTGKSAGSVFQLNVSALASGSYTLHVSTEHGVLNERVMVTR